MVSANLDTLELELRKLDGVRTVGFSTQHDVLYIQLFIEANAPAAVLPFEATRIAQRHSSSPVAVELVRWTDVSAPSKPSTSGLGSIFENTQAAQAVSVQEEQEASSTPLAGSIGSSNLSQTQTEDSSAYDEGSPVEATGSEALASAFADGVDPSSSSEPEFVDQLEEIEELNNVEELIIENVENDENSELDITFEDKISETFETTLEEEPVFENRREDDSDFERIELLLVTTSAENDEIEVHLAFDDSRTIGRAPTNRGLLGAIDATVSAIAELTGSDEFHAEWARSLEPGAEHASLVAVGLTNSQGTDTRHGIAGGSSPIEAAARATLNALNRTAVLSASDQ